MVVCIPKAKMHRTSSVLKWFVESHAIEAAHKKTVWAILFKSLWVGRHSRYSNVCAQALKKWVLHLKHKTPVCSMHLIWATSIENYTLQCVQGRNRHALLHSPLLYEPDYKPCNVHNVISTFEKGSLLLIDVQHVIYYHRCGLIFY